MTSVGIFGERLAGGAPDSAIAGDVATTVAALALASALPPRSARGRSLLVAAIAAGAGALVVHRMLAALHPTPWMAEGPRQLVNDAVAALATLGLVVAFARRQLRLACVVGLTAFVGAYALTHAMWHVDRVPRLVATVQQCVVAQFFSVLAALFVHRELRRSWGAS